MTIKAIRIFAWLAAMGLIARCCRSADGPIDLRAQKRSLCPEITRYPHQIKFVLRLGATDVPQAIAEADKIAHSTFEEVDRHFNRWNASSELSIWNHLPSDTPFDLSRPLRDLLQIVDRAVKLTEGRFDPTVEPACALWRQRLDQGAVPTVAEVNSLRALTGWDAQLTRCFAKKRGPVQLDLGAIAKGHCVDLIAERLKQRGIENFYIDWGGELRALGTRADGSFWRAGVPICRDGLKGVNIVLMRDVSIATSGSDRQTWRVQSENYTHIIDPITCLALKPSKMRPVTCTVMAKSCALADALATAGMLFSTGQEGLNWFSTLAEKDFYCVWLSDERETLRFWHRGESQAALLEESFGLFTP